MASFLRDPVRAFDRHFSPLGRAIEIRRIERFPRRLLFTCDPEYNRCLLLNARSMRTAGLWPVKAPFGSAQRSLGDNPLAAHGAAHAAFRELIDPYLSRTAVYRHYNDVRLLVVSEIERWQPGTHDFYKLARRCTEPVAFNLLFGAHEHGRLTEFADLLHEYHRANWGAAARVLRLDLPGTPYRKVLSKAEELRTYLGSWMDAPDQISSSKCLFWRLTAIRAADSCPIPKEDIAGTIAMLSWTAYETSATVLAWTVFLLAQHPAVLADLIDELSAQNSVLDMDAHGLSALPLLDAVIKEAMRLITPVPFIRLRMAEDRDIAGQRFIRGSRFLLIPHLTHRLPELYAAPDRFRPGRWFSIKPSAYEYMPFGGGERRCPGFWLAMINLKLALATLLSRFRPFVPAGARIDRTYAVVTMPRNGVPIELAPSHSHVPVRANGSRSGSIFDLFTPEADRPVRP